MSQTGQREPSGSTPRKVNGKAFVADVRAGMDDTGLMEKHDLTASGLWRIFDKLVIAGLLDSTELQARRTQTAVAHLTWKCPACGSPQSREFDTCPQCGIIVAKFLSKKTSEEKQAQEAEAEATSWTAKEQTSPRDWSVHPYYRRRFDELEAKGGFMLTWNWAAFFLGNLWYLLRGLWAKALLMGLLFSFVLGMSLAVTGFRDVGCAEAALYGWWLIYSIVVSVYCGICGTYDYFLWKRKKTQLW